MVYSYLGARYARSIKSGLITLADVPARSIQTVRDSYVELFGFPLEDVGDNE